MRPSRFSDMRIALSIGRCSHWPAVLPSCRLQSGSPEGAACFPGNRELTTGGSSVEGPLGAREACSRLAYPDVAGVRHWRGLGRRCRRGDPRPRGPLAISEARHRRGGDADPNVEASAGPGRSKPP